MSEAMLSKYYISTSLERLYYFIMVYSIYITTLWSVRIIKYLDM